MFRRTSLTRSKLLEFSEDVSIGLHIALFVLHNSRYEDIYMKSMKDAN